MRCAGEERLRRDPRKPRSISRKKKVLHKKETSREIPEVRFAKGTLAVLAEGLYCYGASLYNRAKKTWEKRD